MRGVSKARKWYLLCPALMNRASEIFPVIPSLLGEKEKCCQAKVRKGSGWWKSFLFLWYAVFFSEVLNCTSVSEYACVFLFCHLKLLGREHASLWNLCSTFPWGLGCQPGCLWLSETVGLIPKPSNKWLVVIIMRIESSFPPSPALLRWRWKWSCSVMSHFLPPHGL